LLKYELDFQRVLPHIHRQNAPERAIRTFKNHMLASLATCDPDFLIAEWDRVLWDYLRQAASDIVFILQNKPSIVHSLDFGNETENALLHISTLLGRAAKPPGAPRVLPTMVPQPTYPPRIQLPTHPPRMQLPIHPPRIQLPAHPPRMQIPTLSLRVQVSPTIHPLRVQVSPNPPRVQAPTFPPRVQVQIHSPRMQSSPLLLQRPSPVIQPHCMHAQSPTFQHRRKTFFNNRH